MAPTNETTRLRVRLVLIKTPLLDGLCQPGLPFWNSTTGSAELLKLGTTVAGLRLGWLFNRGHLRIIAV